MLTSIFGTLVKKANIVVIALENVQSIHKKSKKNILFNLWFYFLVSL